MAINHMEVSTHLFLDSAFFLLTKFLCYFIAYKIEKGDRYILAGFLNYGPDTHEQFLKMYNPVYDGHAGAAGFKSGDLITGISYCRVKKDAKKKEQEEKVSDTSEPQCKTVAEPEPEVIKKIKKITLKTTDDEWKRYAQSCEQLLPKESITFRIKRSVPDILPSVDEIPSQAEL